MAKVSRRQVMGMVGIAAALVPVTAAASMPGARTRKRLRQRTAASDPEPFANALLEPLHEGARLGEWRIDRIGECVQAGALVVAMSRGTHQFYLDICLRDRGSGAPLPPARTDRFDIFVANEGNGQTPTDERDGLAALAIAEIVRTNEERVRLPGMMTLRDRLRAFPDQIARGFRGL